MLIVSGLSGSGKSTAIKVLEDIGYFCVDNLPLLLVHKFYELCVQSAEISKAALVIDVRERGFLKASPRVFKKLDKIALSLETLFLEASDEVLIRRFSETRRPHPMAPEGPVLEGIKRERLMLEGIRRRAGIVLDTSFTTVHDVKRIIHKRYAPFDSGNKMSVTVISFGYGRGIPFNADVVIDVRFLPNPYYVEDLRDLTGNDEPVVSFILEKSETASFLDKLYNFIDYLLPLYEKEGKSYFVLAIGCTGGRHRSVALANQAASHIRERGFAARVEHRDLTGG